MPPGRLAISVFMLGEKGLEQGLKVNLKRTRWHVGRGGKGQNGGRKDNCNGEMGSDNGEKWRGNNLILNFI